MTCEDCAFHDITTPATKVVRSWTWNNTDDFRHVCNRHFDLQFELTKRLNAAGLGGHQGREVRV